MGRSGTWHGGTRLRRIRGEGDKNDDRENDKAPTTPEAHPLRPPTRVITTRVSAGVSSRAGIGA